ncbi:hypothetical protein K469DRAFT_733860 [Zopfia rhizophila CBS 207.26]|uniref:Small ribosomal subunit protein uS4 N-terminal domain-containing protein n=1 Tax=Zopfia rhizophila CBS 207.26 TaxID=1314779 RepID=A0A6A6EZ22_9PEZI|nr:hypothetical protein K469DRAFT_733860 [Zopfia rhizophila CBS 207.26]
MVRRLNYHEQKLLKFDFYTYKSDGSHRDTAVIQRYAIQKPDNYRKYNIMCGYLRQLAHRLSNLDPSDPFRRKHEDLLLEKLFDMGILGTGGGRRGKLSDVEHKVTVLAFARRRLPAATKFVEQGHVRVSTEVVTDTAFLVTRNMEDFVTWVDSSKIKRNIMKYRDKLDDLDLAMI